MTTRCASPAPDARRLAGVYWDAYMAAEPMFREGTLPLGSLAAETVRAMEAGALAVVAEALPSVALLDEALRKACAERDAEGAIIRDVLESLCRRAGLPLESAAEPGEPARNYELADRLGVGHVFGLQSTAPAEPQAAPRIVLAPPPPSGPVYGGGDDFTQDRHADLDPGEGGGMSDAEFYDRTAVARDGYPDPEREMDALAYQRNGDDERDQQ